MDLKKVRTRQETCYSDHNPKGKDYLIGLDIGYSSTKIFWENGHTCFPSYAMPLDHDIIFPDENDIRYRDAQTGEIYLIGCNAQNMVRTFDTNETDSELYSRKRYGNPRFRILCNTALALATQQPIKEGSRKIFIQTGLPSSYLAGDMRALKMAVANNTPFSLSIGKGPWKEYQFHIQEEDIAVIPQPMGALYSTIIGNDGKFIQSKSALVPDAYRILTGKTLVLDAGFGTFDFYGLIERNVVCEDSIDDIGMRAILEQMLKLIQEDTGMDIRLAAIQPILEAGSFSILDEEKMKRYNKPIKPYLEKANEIVFEKAKKKILAITHSFQDYNSLIIDGGCGEAWFKDLKEWLRDMNLNIYPSNFNDHLEMLYSNARGYYMCAAMNQKHYG